MRLSRPLHAVLTGLDLDFFEASSCTSCTAAHLCCWWAAGALVCIASVHNLLRRHPATCVLLHRPAPRPQAPDQATAGQQPAPTEDGTAAGDAGDKGRQAAGVVDTQGSGAAGPGHDPYLAEEEDPAESRAIESSLWEMDSLRNHYAPQVPLPSPLRSMSLSGAQCMQGILRLCRAGRPPNF